MVTAKIVSRETLDRIDVLCAMVERWNKTINLVARASVPDLRHRHVADSAQIAAFLPDGATHWVDLGAGAGFPGLVVAAHLADTAPDCRVTLIEADQRKSVFLREAARAMGIQTRVMATRIEDAPNQQADVVSARALAGLPRLFILTSLHLRSGGAAIFLKGQEIISEQEDAARDGWKFDAVQHKSLTDPAGTIMIVRNLSREPST